MKNIFNNKQHSTLILRGEKLNNKCLVLKSIVLPEAKEQALETMQSFVNEFPNFNVGINLGFQSGNFEKSQIRRFMLNQLDDFPSLTIWTNLSEKKKYGGIEQIIKEFRNDEPYSGKGKLINYEDEMLEYDYLMLLDSDSKISETDLNKMIEYAEESPEYSIYSPQIIVNKPTSEDDYLQFLYEHSHDLMPIGDMPSKMGFCGKGLIRIKKFNLLSDNFSIPVLSHDIIEGGLNKTDVVYDAIMYEEFPSSVKSFYTRFERWTRGDLQNFIFLFSRKLNRESKKRILQNIDTLIKPLIIIPFALLLSWFHPIFTVVYILAWLFYPMCHIKARGNPAIWYWYSQRFLFKVSGIVLGIIPIVIGRLITKRNLLEWNVCK
jgi:cellulose synthase/poly-beta-1,6-N-acetylglucosamine synthase-like glycosyltransferase